MFIILFSCSTHKEISNEELNSVLYENINKYNMTNDLKYLNQAYDFLVLTKVYKKDNIHAINNAPITSILLNLGKYDELEKFMFKTKAYTQYQIQTSVNLAKYFAEPDFKKSTVFIHNNLHLINDSIKRNNSDSMIYFDYYNMKALISGKEVVLKEIDSISKNQAQFSEAFYQILRSSIVEIPNAYFK